MKLNRPVSLVAATLSMSWLGSATATASAVRNRKLALCDELYYEYEISNGNTLNSQKSDGNFNVPDDGSFRCNLSCSQGDAKIYIKFGTSTSPAGPNNYDVKDDADDSGCNKELIATNLGGDTKGIAYTVMATNYQDLKIRCKCYTESTPPARGSGCFAASATVQVQEKGVVAMRDLQVGDNVLVDPLRNLYEPIYAFGHWHDNWKTDFIRIHYKGYSSFLSSLKLTPKHLVFVQGVLEPIRADQLHVGQPLVGSTFSGTNEEDTITITKISQTLIQQPRFYMPLTASGKLIVNNIVASAYVSIADDAPIIAHHPWLRRLGLSEHNLLHLWMTPVRILCLGVSSNLGCRTAKPTTIEEGDGIMPWLLTGKIVADYANDQSRTIQVVLGAPLLLVLGILYGVECVVGPTLAAFGFALLVMAFVRFLCYSRNRDQMQKA